MAIDTWNTCHAAICSISFLNAEGNKISSGTGFKVGETLVTNNHVFACPGAASVELMFVEADGYTIRARKTIAYSNFYGRLLDALPGNSWDHAILRLDDTEFSVVPSLELGTNESVSIGSAVAILGFQFDQANLSIKTGIISSRFERTGVKYLQLDASVNHGNSGGPLIDMSTNRVIGIVTRKHTGLTEAFDELVSSFDGNIQALEASMVGGGMTLMGINPIEVLAVSQRQLKLATKEIKRSANVGIGYAYQLEKILEYFN
jgi:V8-like Glu-specific endopeptidase